MKPNALFLLAEDNWDYVYGPAERADAEKVLSFPHPFQTESSIQKNPAPLADTEIIFSGWGMPLCDEAFLQAAPRLKAIFYGAGSVRCFVTDALWDRGIRVSSSNSMLAIPVAEFALGQILLGLKGAFQMARDVHHARKYVWTPFPGIYGSTVGLVSIGTIARILIPLLKPFNLRVIAYDPLLPAEEAHNLGIELCSLDEVFSRSHAVSVHTPWLPETERLIRASHFRLMRQNAVFVNTARGAIVDETGLIEVFSERPDLYALLDVTHPEPPAPDSPLYRMPNVMLTPHLAGPRWNECRRLGRMAVEECRRYLEGKPLQGEVTREKMAYIA